MSKMKKRKNNVEVEFPFLIGKVLTIYQISIRMQKPIQRFHSLQVRYLRSQGGKYETVFIFMLHDRFHSLQVRYLQTADTLDQFQKMTCFHSLQVRYLHITEGREDRYKSTESRFHSLQVRYLHSFKRGVLGSDEDLFPFLIGKVLTVIRLTD